MKKEFQLLDKGIKEIKVNCPVYHDLGSDENIPSGVFWNEFLNEFFGTGDFEWDLHFSDLIRKIDFSLWDKWDRAFSWIEELQMGLNF